MPDERYRATLERLFALRRFGMRPGLEVMRGLLSGLDHPERSFRAIHVTGSKGKGSVSAMAAAILSAQGIRVGLFTSPHLVSYRERIRVSGEPIGKEAIVEGVERIDRIASELSSRGAIDRPPTFFEVTTALAFDHFRASGVEHAVVEVGLGGRLDSTNVLDAPVGVITTIELEHTDVLGSTLGAIASEKAGIFHPGMRGIVGPVSPEALREIERAAATAGVPLLHLDREIRVSERSLSPSGQTITVTTPQGTRERLRLPVFGVFQPSNAALALAAVEEYARATGVRLTQKAIRDGLRQFRWRGRLERLVRHPDLYVDAAHTPESARAVALSLAEIHPFADPSDNVVLFSCLSDKRAGAMLEILAPIARTLIVAPLASDRALSLAELKREGHGRFPKVVAVPTISDGIRLARAATGDEGFTIALGSDYLVGELLRALEGTEDDEPDLSDPVRAPAVTRPTEGR